MADMQDHTVTHDAGRLRRCPQCGYSLEGLPACGVCPECGAAYDDQTIVLYGWSPGRAPSWTDSWWGATLITSLVAGICIVAIALVARQRGPLAGGVGLLAACVLIVGVHYRRRRQLHSEVPPVQVRLSRSGFGQRSGFGPVHLVAWDRQQAVTMQAMRHPGDYRLVIKVTSPLVLRLRAEVVNLEFRADEASAQRMFLQIGQWWLAPAP